MDNSRNSSTGPDSPPRILIIEDEVMIADLLESMLCELGYEVAGTAHTLSSALRELDKNNFHAALVDSALDGTRSPEIPDRLQEIGVPFAFVTGYEQSLEPRHRGAPLIQKPFGIKELGALLEELAGPPSSSVEIAQTF
jgi:DNA-binding response OmpR family regulator